MNDAKKAKAQQTTGKPKEDRSTRMASAGQQVTQQRRDGSPVSESDHAGGGESGEYGRAGSPERDIQHDWESAEFVAPVCDDNAEADFG